MRVIGKILLIVILLVGCDAVDPYEPDTMQATVDIISIEQNYYESLGGWSDLVQVWYSIENTGSTDIDYYKIWLKATCADGSTYEDWTNGLGLDAGHAITDSMFINIPGKEVLRVRVTDSEFNTWGL